MRCLKRRIRSSDAAIEVIILYLLFHNKITKAVVIIPEIIVFYDWLWGFIAVT